MKRDVFWKQLEKADICSPTEFRVAAGLRLAGKRHNFAEESHCREEIARSFSEFIERKVFGRNSEDIYYGGAGEDCEPLGIPSLVGKSAEIALSFTEGPGLCPHPCCVGPSQELLEGVLGSFALLLIPRWKGKARVVLSKEEVLWANASPLIFTHPMLLSLFLGVFRQTMLSCVIGNRPRIPKGKTSFKQILKAIFPIISCPGNSYGFPLRDKDWDTFVKLQQRTQEMGLEAGIGETFLEGWRWKQVTGGRNGYQSCLPSFRRRLPK